MNDFTFSIGDKVIGSGQPAYIIAEAGVNHNGRLDLALELVRAAKRTGADCVKFQTFQAENLVTSSSPKAAYQLKTTDPSESQFQMLKKLELPIDAYREIISLCKKEDIQFLSTPYSLEDVDFLQELGVNAFKIASGQIVEPLFLKHIAKTGKPLILSTGMADMSEVFRAVSVIREAGNHNFSILQCTTNYPASADEANLLAIPTLRAALGAPVGYSDHVPENHCAFASIALGACVIEKHFTLDRKMEGPDHSCSLDEGGFRELVNGIRAIEAGLGNGIKVPSAAEIQNAKGMRRSIVARKSIPKGTLISIGSICFKRPATGLAPMELEKILGKPTGRDIAADEMIHLSDISW